MTTDPHAGPDGGAPDLPSRLTLRDVALSLGVGLVLAAVLALVTPDVRTHLVGGTDRRETTVVAVREGTRSGGVGQPLTTYELRWSVGGEDRSATFRRAGDPDHEVGDSWVLWVSPDGSEVETSSPIATWLWLGIGMPVFVLVIGAIVRWRGRTMARAVLREADRIEARRQRRAARSQAP